MTDRPLRPGSRRFPEEGQRRFAEAVLRFRFAILAVAAILTGFLGWQAVRLRTDWNEQKELSSRDRDVRDLQRFIERFGGQEYLLVVLDSDGLFTPGGLEYLRDLTEALRDVPNASEVVSLSTVPVVRGRGGEIRAEPFFDEPPETREEAETLFREALGQPLWRGALLSADGRTA